jgi:hypothetical protein
VDEGAHDLDVDGDCALAAQDVSTGTFEETR